LNLKALKECILHINALMACAVQNAPTDENVATNIIGGNLEPLMLQLFINQDGKISEAELIEINVENQWEIKKILDKYKVHSGK
ncbi:hypothetical protein FQN51_006820, partial [Onygenales sp. PD_10]